ncbi:DEAD/DEAH box helicase family protein [bacterium]|nr:DEAD/DEAH box helicase family protein [bacterium]
MKNIRLKPFQEKAIADLRKQFLELWKTGNRKLPLVFKAPTGSGKTIMVAQFLRDLTGDPQFDADKAFLWFSFSEDSYTQSKNKFFDYYGGASELNLLDLNDLNRGKLEKNNLFFINWQKIKDSTKEGRKLRREDENTQEGLGLFDGFIRATQKDGREPILIIDEAHRDTDTELADELLSLIDPRIILKITATPKGEPSISDVNHKRAGFVEVDRKDVIDSGLIKEKIVTQTKEDLAKMAKKGLHEDDLLLSLALKKANEIKKLYREMELGINPLVIIQLPNDDQATKETTGKSKLDIVKEFLKKKGVKDRDIAIWLSEKKENLDEIEKNDSEVSFLIFKQAAATGWDCPRASTLVMFREIKNPIFHTQTVGRILRMPEAKHYSKPELNISYLYTNYARNQIQLPDHKNGNKPFVHESRRKDIIKPIELESTFMGRADYNDLGDTFQIIFKSICDDFFGIQEDDKAEVVKNKTKAKNLDTEDYKIENKLIVDAEIDDYDNFVQEIRDRGEDLSVETSRNDLERMYNLLCFNIILKQEAENKKFAPERSWGKLKTALNVWFSERVGGKRENYYKIIVKDLLKEDSVLRKIISEALEKYRPLRQAEVQRKESRTKRTEKLKIPRPSLFYTDDYKATTDIDGVKLSKNSMVPFYLQEAYSGRNNEVEFIKYLESKKSVIWWYKNGNTGSEHFSLPYYDKEGKKERLFYPDWIVKIKNKVLVLDTKQGMTADSRDTKYKAEVLQEWLAEQKGKMAGGIIVKASGIWRLNNQKGYSYYTNLKDWVYLDELF